MTRSSRKRTNKNRKAAGNQTSSRGWTTIALVAAIAVLAVAGWYFFDQTGAAAVAEHEHGEAAEAVDHIHTAGDVEMPHLHGMGFSGDGNYLSVAVHDGLRLFADGEWLIPAVPRNDYMGYSPVDEGFYSSGHPGPGVRLANPLGLVKSTDMGETLTKLGFEGESDFHLMDAGYYNHAIYVLNPRPNSRLAAGVHYTLDEGKTWQQSALQGVVGQPIQIAVHPHLSNGNVVALATEGGLFLSSDYGNTFEPIVEGEPVTAATFSPDGKKLLFGYQKLYAYDLASKQTDELQIPAIAEDDAIGYLAVNPAEPQTIALATFGRNLYLSNDSGETWQQIAQEGKGKEGK